MSVIIRPVGDNYMANDPQPPTGNWTQSGNVEQLALNTVGNVFITLKQKKSKENKFLMRLQG